MNRDIKPYHGVGKIMDKRPLIGISLCVVILFVVGSLSNVMGYQTSRVTINAEEDITLDSEMNRSSESECDCNSEDTNQWGFPILCAFLYPLLVLSVILLLLLHYYPFYNYMEVLAKELNCFWAQPG
jgi:hypothetical protein